MCYKIVIKIPNTIFHENSPGVSRAVPCRNRYDEANSRSSQLFCDTLLITSVSQSGGNVILDTRYRVDLGQNVMKGIFRVNTNKCSSKRVV
jgi:hypothetical protein